MSQNHIVLPEQLVGSVDLSRAIRELELLDEAYNQNELRGKKTLPEKPSTILAEVAHASSVDLKISGQREQLLTLLNGFKEHAPRIRITLANEASTNFIRKLLIWMRTNLHPLLLLEVGLQPTMAAGCIIRTENKVFDMSLRHHFTENRHVLLEKINEVSA